MTESSWTMLLSWGSGFTFAPDTQDKTSDRCRAASRVRPLQSTFKQNLQDGLTVLGNSTVRGSSTIYITQTFHCRVAREPVKSRVSEVFNLVEIR